MGALKMASAGWGHDEPQGYLVGSAHGEGVGKE